MLDPKTEETLQPVRKRLSVNFLLFLNTYSIICHVRKSSAYMAKVSLVFLTKRKKIGRLEHFFFLLGYCPLINRNHRSATQQHVSLRPAVTGAPCLTVIMVNEATQQRARQAVCVGGLSADPHHAFHTLNLSQV